MPVLVRNLEKGPSVFTDAETKQAIEWGGRDDPRGEDLQYVPENVVVKPAFLKAIDKGIYEVVEADDTTRELLARQAADWRHRQDHIESRAKATIDPSTERQLAHVQVAEDGRITGVPAPTEKHDKDGKEIETSIPVIIEQRGTSVPQP